MSNVRRHPIDSEAHEEKTPCLRIELLEHVAADRSPGSLAISYPYGGCSKSIVVFFDRVRALAGRTDYEPALLGYVLAHEITHVLQRVDRHSSAGVMKAQWDADDRAAIFERRLRFEPIDLELLQALNGQFESRTGSHPE